MEFLEYFKEREKDLIKAVGEKDWEANKVYYVEEIAEIVNEWQLKFLPIQRVINLVCPKCGNTGRCEPRTLSDPDGQECDCGQTCR